MTDTATRPQLISPAGVTAMATKELARGLEARRCCRAAQVASSLRFAGTMHHNGGQVIVEAALRTAPAARRLQADIQAVYGHPAQVREVTATGERRGPRYLVRITGPRAGQLLARQAGLVDGLGRPVRGLPAHVVLAPDCDSAAVWRGAFLARGTLAEAAGVMTLKVTCPGPEAALALAGAARRLRVPAKIRDTSGTAQVVIKDGWCITMLSRLGAHGAARAWEESREHRAALKTAAGDTKASGSADANFRASNERRRATAAAVAVARATRALEILGDSAPPHLAAAGRLRIAHPGQSVQALGQLADPVVSKHSLEGRLRRLVNLADRTAARRGIPDTWAAGSTAANPRPATPGR
jgi:DNA-binding protein WhiA